MNFFYKKSNYKIGASKNNLQLEIKLNKKELFNNNYLENNSDKHTSLTNKKFGLFEGLAKSKLNSISQKKLFIFYQFLSIYTLKDFYHFLFRNLKKLNQI